MIFNTFQQLRKQALSESTREYKARGIKVKRCSVCQLMVDYCICNEHPSLSSNVDFILLYHPDEIFKPTNTGRLIADAFPENTFAFSHSRTKPQKELLDLINDPNRECIIVFPVSDEQQRNVVTDLKNTSVAKNKKNIHKKLTLIFLDGTWRQGRRMFNGSQWLQSYSVLRINPSDKSLYATRKAACDSHLSTAESAALALASAGDEKNAQALFDYFSLFNRRYSKMRSNLKPKT